MSRFLTTFRELEKIIHSEYASLDLKCWEEYEIDKKHPLTFFTEEIRDISPINPFNWYEFITEIEFLSKDLKYYTTILFLLRPFINNPLREDKTYYQTIEDNRYMSYVSMLYQIIYNYWDRLGDFLFYFIETGLKERNVYFSTVITSISEDFKESVNYQKLLKIYVEYLKELFDNRKNIVHYLQISAKMFSGTFLHHNDEKKLLEMEKEKNGYPDFFQKHLELSLEGFEYSVKLVSESKT